VQQEAVRAHLCSGVGLPAGLAGWSLLQWVYETLSHAATIDSTLSATGNSSPSDTRLPSDLAEQLAQRAAALLWPAAPLTAQQLLQLQQEQLAPGALVQRAVAAAAAAAAAATGSTTSTSSSVPPAPASATAALQRLAWIVDRHKDALRVVAAVKEQLTGVLTGAGRGLKRKGGKRKSADVATLTSALTQLESVPSVRIVEPVLDAVKSSLQEAQVAAAASAEHSASGENEFYDGHDAGAYSDEGYSDEDEDSMQVDTSRSADGLDEEFTVDDDDEYGDAPRVSSAVPPRAHATRLGGVHRPLKLDDSDLDLSSSEDEAAKSVAATAAALARAKVSKGSSSYKKSPSSAGAGSSAAASSSSVAKAAGAAAAAEKKKSTARISPFGRLLKVCARCKQAHQGAVKCRVVDKHWGEPDWDDDSGAQKWRPPAGFMQWYTSEGAAAYGSGSKQSSGTPSPRTTSAAAASSSKVKQPGASPGSYSSAYGSGQLIGVQALRPQCLVDGCTRTAAQTSPYCSQLCAAQSGSTVLRAVRARREQLVAAGKMPASTAAAASAVAPSQTVGSTAAAASTTAAAEKPAAVDGDSMDVDTGATQPAAGVDTLAAAVAAAAAAAPQPTAAEAAAAAEWQSAVAAALQRLAAGGAAAEHDKLLRNRARVRERLESVFAEGLKHFGASPSATVNQLWAWDLEQQIYKLYPKAKLTEYKVCQYTCYTSYNVIACVFFLSMSVIESTA
jgi:hypothetical protein